MTRKPDTSEDARLKRYLEIERAQGAEGSHPAAKALHERPKTRSDTAKVKEYVRIERGHEV